MLNDVNYTNIKLLHDLSSTLWYLKKHAKEDAKRHKHDLCVNLYDEIEADLEKNIQKLSNTIEGMSKTGHFK